jgi:alpha-galactosidase
MPSAVKLGVIGAGSAVFSVGVVRDICLRESLAGSHVTLMDVDEERLRPMYEFAQRYARELGADVTFDMTVDRSVALQDADFVLNTAMYGGREWVEAFRAWSEQQGYYRGFRANDIMNIRLMLDVARDMERLCPEAWLIQAGNPVFEGCTAMTRETGIKVCGICHGHYGYRELAETLGLDPDKVSAQAVGFNHVIFLTHMECEGRNVLPLIDEWIAGKSKQYWSDHHPEFWDNQMARAAVEIYKLAGLFPIGDTTRKGGWWFHTDLATKKRWYGGELGGFDSELGWDTYQRRLDRSVARIHNAVADTATKLTEVFPPERTDEQHFPLIDGLVNDNRVELQVNVPNRGAIEGIPDDVVVEVPAMCSTRGVQPYHVGRLPELLMVSVLQPRLVEAERLISVSLHPDARMLLAMVLDDHRTRSYEQAVQFSRDLLARPGFEELALEIQRHGGTPDFSA